MNRIILPKEYYQIAKDHLFQGFEEHFLFFLCRIKKVESGVDFFVEDIELISEHDTKAIGYFSVEIALTRLIEVMNKANHSGLALIEAHNHPRHFGNKFSYTDEIGFSEFVPYVLDVLRRSYGATVWENDIVIRAIYWDFDTSEYCTIHSIEVTGTQDPKIIHTIPYEVQYIES